MYLLDTNILLELLLEQSKADVVEHFLRTAVPRSLSLSEFSLYSLGIILLRYNQHDAFLSVKNDLIDGGVNLVRLLPEDMEAVVLAAKRFKLDFDDAYQYQVAVKHGLDIVSFDAHFDRTDLHRKTPMDFIQG